MLLITFLLFLGIGVSSNPLIANTVDREDTSRDVQMCIRDRTIIDNSNKSYLVMEEEKYNYDEFYKFAKLDDVSGIITEERTVYNF